MSSATTTWSAVGTRCTFRSSDRSRTRLMSVLASMLCPPLCSRSFTSSGCSENFAPHAITTATRLEINRHARHQPKTRVQIVHLLTHYAEACYRALLMVRAHSRPRALAHTDSAFASLIADVCETVRD